MLVWAEILPPLTAMTAHLFQCHTTNFYDVTISCYAVFKKFSSILANPSSKSTHFQITVKIVWVAIIKRVNYMR